MAQSNKLDMDTLHFNNELLMAENNLAFMNVLPFDILIQIFSHFTKTECLRAMQVCKQWYHTIPMYTENVWSSITIFGYHGLYKQTRWLHFVGKHVKRITFRYFRREKELYFVMQNLLDHGCGAVQYLAFEFCNATEQENFLPLLWKLTRHITELSMRDHLSNVPILRIMNACPTLTQFKLDVSIHAYDHGFQRKEPPYLIGADDHCHDPPILFSLPQEQIGQLQHITELHFICQLHKQFRLEPILQRCPHLVILSYVNNSTLDPSSMDDLKTLVSWCPKLKYLEININKPYTYKNRDRRETILVDIKNNKNNIQQGIEYLLAIESARIGPQQLETYLSLYGSTLKYLHLDGRYRHLYNYRGRDWTRALQFLHDPPQLTTLILDAIIFQSNALLSMIQQCTRLTTLKIHHGGNETLTLDASQLLLPLKRLKHLALRENIRLSFNHDDSNGLIINPFGGSDIEYISLDPHVLNSNITHQFLLQTTHLQQLKHLQVGLDDTYEDQGLCLFAKQLTNTSIENMTLFRLRSLPKEFLCALGNLPSLKELKFFEIRDENRHEVLKVDGTGLFQMLHQSASLNSIFIIQAHLLDGNDIKMAMYEENLNEKYRVSVYSINNRAPYPEVGNWRFERIHSL